MDDGREWTPEDRKTKTEVERCYIQNDMTETGAYKEKKYL